MRFKVPLTQQACEHIQSEMLAGRFSAGSRILEKRIADALRRGDAEAARRAVAEPIQASRRESLEQHHATLDPNASIANDLPSDLIEELERIEGNAGDR